MPGSEAPHDTRTTRAESPPDPPARVGAAWRVGALAVGVAVAVGAWQWLPHASPGRPGVMVRRLTFDSGVQTDPALSPDGRFVAYTANKKGNFDIEVQPIDGGNPIPVTTNAAHDWQPNWSPDGSRIAFRSERGSGGLFVVPATGGTEEKVSGFGYWPRYSPDGTQLLFTGGDHGTAPFYTVGLDHTPQEPHILADLGTRNRAAWGWDSNGRVTLLSGGRDVKLLTADLERGTTVQSEVEEHVRQRFRELSVTTEGDALAWDPRGTALYFIGVSGEIPNLWMIDIDPGTRAVTGGPYPLTTMTEGAINPTISRDGLRIAVGGAMGNARLWSYPLDRTGTNLGNPRPLTPPEMSADGLDLSADGTNLVFLLHRPGSSEPLEWRERRMPEGPEHYLLSMDQAHGERRGPVVWSRDGRRVAYRYLAPRSAAFESGASILYNAPQSIRVLDTRTGDDFPLTSTAPLLEFPTGWSTDGLPYSRVECATKTS